MPPPPPPVAHPPPHVLEGSDEQEAKPEEVRRSVPVPPADERPPSPRPPRAKTPLARAGGSAHGHQKGSVVSSRLGLGPRPTTGPAGGGGAKSKSFSKPGVLGKAKTTPGAVAALAASAVAKTKAKSGGKAMAAAPAAGAVKAGGGSKIKAGMLAKRAGSGKGGGGSSAGGQDGRRHGEAELQRKKARSLKSTGRSEL